jgi:hypothetical protein
MKYYVINNKTTRDGAYVNQFDTIVSACAFIEKKLEGFVNYHVTDFQVIGGQLLGIRVETERKVYLTT